MEAFVCDTVRTPLGRFGGSLSTVRPDDLAALTISTLMERNAGVDWDATDDVIFGAANQAGEDNRNVARMALLLAGMSVDVSGVTVNRLCGSGMETVGQAARAIKSGEADLIIAGGSESMSRAPKVIAKPETAAPHAPATTSAAEPDAAAPAPADAAKLATGHWRLARTLQFATPRVGHALNRRSHPPTLPDSTISMQH